MTPTRLHLALPLLALLAAPVAAQTGTQASTPARMFDIRTGDVPTALALAATFGIEGATGSR